MMSFQPVILLTDALFFFLTTCLVAFILYARKKRAYQSAMEESF